MTWSRSKLRSSTWASRDNCGTRRGYNTTTPEGKLTRISAMLRNDTWTYKDNCSTYESNNTVSTHKITLTRYWSMPWSNLKEITTVHEEVTTLQRRIQTIKLIDQEHNLLRHDYLKRFHLEKSSLQQNEDLS